MFVTRHLAQRSVAFWVLAGYLALVALLGGSARADTFSLLILRPAAVLACCYAVWRMPPGMYARYWPLFALFAAALGLVLLHLVPLPPSLWTALPGREIVGEIDRVTGAGAIWRPLSLAPKQSWNAFFALFVPLAALLLAVQLDGEDRAAIVPVFLVIGIASVLIGVLQLLGPSNGPLYFYRITNHGSPVGLFANRNHFAVYAACMLPMLAYWASNARNPEAGRGRLVLALVVGLAIIPVLLRAGSRAGVLAGVLCLGLAFLIYRRPAGDGTHRKRQAAPATARLMKAAGIAAIAVIGGLIVLLARAPVFERLTVSGASEDARWPAWQAVTDMVWQYWPVGSGLGSFVEVYKVGEPFALLKPSYFNHAHNDPLELLLTGGLPAVLLMAAAAVLVAVRTWQAWRRPASRRIDLARLGSVLMVTLVLASIADYPLRVPSLACFAVLLLVWMEAAVAFHARRAENNGCDDGYPLSGAHSPS